MRRLPPDVEGVDLPEIQWDKNEYAGLQKSALSPEGTEYQVVAYEGNQGGGPAFLGVEEGGAPMAARFLVDLVNRGLRLLPRQPTSSTFPVVAVMQPSGGGIRQLHTVHAADSADVKVLIADLVAQIEAGTFVPQPLDEDEQAMDQQADLEEMPEDKEGVLDNYDHPASVSLAFEPAEGAAALLSHYADLTDRPGGWHQPCVWFAMQPDSPRASVLLGSTVIGEAAVPVPIWRAMRDLASEDLYADGFLDFRLPNDLLETGTLVCYYPAD